MIIYDIHLKSLQEAIEMSDPIILMPSLHPLYLQSLLAAWQGQDRQGREVRLIEPWFGSMSVTSEGIGAPSPNGRGESLAQWLMSQYDNLSVAKTRLWWIADMDSIVADPQQVSALVATARRVASANYKLRILTNTPTVELPQTLKPWVRSLDLITPRPAEDESSDEDDKGYIDSFGLRILCDILPDGKGLSEQLSALKLKDGASASRQFSSTLQGLDAGAMNIVVNAFYSGWRDDIDLSSQWSRLADKLSEERKRQLQRASGLTIESVSSEELEGMNRFQRYLEYVNVLFHDQVENAKDTGPRPKGVLLVGLPGCGKSLAAHTTARKLGVPLLRMDIGGMMGRYLGESEGNLRRALDAAEAAAPCVLWVDELEKALGGLSTGSDSSGTGSRMLAQLLTWMQSHDAPVYLFATANKVSELPPELMRRGRFDELWRVMLPTDNERLQILLSKFKKIDRVVSPKGESSECDKHLLNKDSKALKELVSLTQGYTGADLESLVTESWMRSRVHEEKISFNTIKSVLEDFKPMSAQFSDKIKEDIEQLERHGFRDVCCDDAVLPGRVPEGRRAGSRLRPELAGVWKVYELYNQSKMHFLSFVSPSNSFNFLVRSFDTDNDKIYGFLSKTKPRDAKEIETLANCSDSNVSLLRVGRQVFMEINTDMYSVYVNELAAPCVYYMGEEYKIVVVELEPFDELNEFSKRSKDKFGLRFYHSGLVHQMYFDFSNRMYGLYVVDGTNILKIASFAKEEGNYPFDLKPILHFNLTGSYSFNSKRNYLPLVYVSLRNLNGYWEFKLITDNRQEGSWAKGDFKNFPTLSRGKWV